MLPTRARLWIVLALLSLLLTSFNPSFVSAQSDPAKSLLAGGLAPELCGVTQQGRAGRYIGFLRETTDESYAVPCERRDFPDTNSDDALAFGSRPATPTPVRSVGSPVTRPDLSNVIAAHGHQAELIARARAAVLDILQERNACSAFFAKADPQAAATFATLRFWVERSGSDHIVKQRDNLGNWVQHGPYIARTSQGTGANTSVALNTNGAFFVALSPVYDIMWPGAPEAHTMLMAELRAGSFRGGSLEAQIITLLHELGHIVGAIPADDMTESGQLRSQTNTEVILDHCKRTAKDASKKVVAVKVRLDQIQSPRN